MKRNVFPFVRLDNWRSIKKCWMLNVLDYIIGLSDRKKFVISSLNTLMDTLLGFARLSCCSWANNLFMVVVLERVGSRTEDSTKEKLLCRGQLGFFFHYVISTQIHFGLCSWNSTYILQTFEYQSKTDFQLFEELKGDSVKICMKFESIFIGIASITKLSYFFSLASEFYVYGARLIALASTPFVRFHRHSFRLVESEICVWSECLHSNNFECLNC